MNVRASTQRGFTLIEVLVAMGLLGIVLMLIMNWQMSTLNISTRTNALARSLNDLNDVTGYVGDRVRAAARVRFATSGITINSSPSFACAEATPCLAIVIPTPTEDGRVTSYDLYVYRMSNRPNVNAADKVTDTWAETNVQVLREFRSDSTSTPRTCVATPDQFSTGTFVETSSGGNVTSCTTMFNLMNGSALSLSGMTPYLVADYLTPASELPSAQQPFTYDATAKEMTLNFRYKQQVRGVTSYLPATEPFTMTVQARNVP